MRTCFVAMPITTTDPSTYQGDADHFRHVLDHLFVPAIERAGFEAIKPIAQGADVIHAEIISSLEKADLVLCDVSTLNPNVFFELGVRTSLNRPICLIRDEKTLRIPFDTTLLNHHTYQSSLAPWDLAEQVVALADHLAISYQRSSGTNALWRHFGLSIVARPAEGTTDADQKLTLLAQQVQLLSQRLAPTDPLLAFGIVETEQDRTGRVFRHLQHLATAEGVESKGGGWGGKAMNMNVNAMPSSELQSRLQAIARGLGYTLTFVLAPQSAP